MSKYKLCRVDVVQSMWVRPIDKQGTDYGNTLMTMEDDGAYYYAIYENQNYDPTNPDNDNDEDWDEWGYYDQDLDKAVEEYNKLMKGDSK